MFHPLSKLICTCSMAPLLHCHRHQMLRSGISWKCLCKSMSALGTGGADWVTENTFHRWYSVDVESMRGGDQITCQGDECSLNVPTTTGRAGDATVKEFRPLSLDRDDICTELARRNNHGVLVRKGSLGSLTSGNFTGGTKEQIPIKQPLRRSLSGFQISGGLRDSNADDSSQVESSINRIQVGSTGPDESVTFVVKSINEILTSAGLEGLEQLEVQFSTPMVAEVIRRQSNVDRAFEFFKWIKERRGFQHSVRTYKIMLHKLMSHRDFTSGKLNIIRDLINQSLADGFSPGVTIRTYLVDAYCQVGNLDEAVEHMNLMETDGCPPNVVTYSALINGFIRVGRVDDALKVLDQMDVVNCEPNVVTYSALIHGLVKDRRLREAWTLFDTMKMKGCAPNLITYSCLIDGLAKAGQYEEISGLLDEMRQVGCTPNVFIYGTLINYCVKVGTLDRAWHLFARMKEDGLVPNLFIFTPIVASFGKAGEWEQARLLLDEMRAGGCYPDVVTYSALIAGLMKAGKWDEACKVLGEMERYGCEPNERTYSSLIEGLVKVGEITKAESLLEQMVAKGCKPPSAIRHALNKNLVVEPVEA